jgi:hypothetical protein
MLGPLLKGITIAASPAGRKAIKTAVKAARSDEGKKILSQARQAATGPQARKIAGQAVATARQAATAAKAPENQERLKAAAKYLRPKRP